MADMVERQFLRVHVEWTPWLPRKLPDYMYEVRARVLLESVSLCNSVVSSPEYFPSRSGIHPWDSLWPWYAEVTILYWPVLLMKINSWTRWYCYWYAVSLGASVHTHINTPNQSTCGPTTSPRLQFGALMCISVKAMRLHLTQHDCEYAFKN